MKFEKFILILFILIAFLPVNAQQSAKETACEYLDEFGEVNLVVSKNNIDLQEFTSQVSIYNVSGDSIWFNVNENEFNRFLKRGIDYNIVCRENFNNSCAATVSQVLQSGFNNYPTYQQYDSIMQKFAADYPAICKYVVIDTLLSGHKIIAVHISDNVAQNEAEPRFFYTSTMHGDEVAGYIFMLKLIDTLLSSYGIDSNLTHIVNNTDLWINPLANPDGTYHGGDNTVSGAIRRNANGIDLNRNFPDPRLGAHPDGNSYQQETQIFMGFADTMNFTMSANFHSGAEVVNYPWDTWYKLTADYSWWKFVSREYADTARYYNNYQGYMNLFGTGVTNGAQWYVISGGRQDFMNYFEHCREVTIELSNVKLLPESQLNRYWNWSKASIVNYLKQVNYGLRGFVTDSATGHPLAAKITVNNHDKDSSHIYSQPPFGDYYRLLDSGYYSVTFSAKGYYSKTFDSVRINRYDTTILNVALAPKPIFISLFSKDENQIPVFPNPASTSINIIFDKPGLEAIIKIFDIKGTVVREKRIKGSGTLYSVNVNDLPEGVYYFTFSTSCSTSFNGGKFIIRR